jgi:hypothetical protein
MHGALEFVDLQQENDIERSILRGRAPKLTGHVLDHPLMVFIEIVGCQGAETHGATDLGKGLRLVEELISSEDLFDEIRRRWFGSWLKESRHRPLPGSRLSSRDAIGASDRKSQKTQRELCGGA